jgi:hypothetical protein
MVGLEADQPQFDVLYSSHAAARSMTGRRADEGAREYRKVLRKVFHARLQS